ncbi:MAG: PAS domain S-box protein [Sphingomicrobium sp.]
MKPERQRPLVPKGERKAAFQILDFSDVSSALLTRQFASAMEHSAIGTAIVSLDGDWLQTNFALRSLFGYDEEELRSKTFQEITHPHDLDADLELVSAVLAGTIPSYQMEKRYQRKDGSYVWATLTVSLVRDADARPLHFVAQIQDISSRKSAEFRQRELTERLSLATRAGGIGIWELDLTTNCTISDPRMLELYGLSADDPRTELDCWTDAIHPDDLSAVQAELQSCIGGKGTFETQFRVIWPDGQIRHIRGLAVTLREEDGSCPRLVGINWDVSDAVRLAEEAAAASRAKSDFLATISHELRTPLHGIIGFADLLRTGDLTPESRRNYLHHLSDAGKSLLAIVNDVLDLSKIEAGELELERTGVDLCRVVEGCEALVRNECEEKGLSLRSYVAPRLPQWIVGDSARLRQVLLNLCVNAKKFTAYGGIRISALPGTEDGWARFEVTDTGIGISEAVQARLFKHFTQADASISRQYGGTGLGLVICKRVVEQMGGAIGVISAPGRGSTFWFEIPIEPLQSLSPCEPLNPAPSQSLRILVAEDVDVNQALVRAILERDGHAVDIVDNGREACAAAANRRYDLILMDIQMPEMDGVTATIAIRNLKEPNRRTPIWAMTANALSEHLDGYLAAGMDDYVTKPFDSAKLLAKLRSWASAADQPDGARETLNADAVDRLIKSIGEDAGASLLSNSAAAIETSAGLIGADSSSREVVAGEAHKIISMAGNVGLERLSEAARLVEDGARTGQELDRSLAAFGREYQSGITALRLVVSNSASSPTRR